MCTVLKWLLQGRKKRDPEPEQVPPSVRARVQRLEIDLGELTEYVEQLRAHHAKLRQSFYGHIGAENRNKVRRGAHSDDETLDEFRERMRREGRLGAVQESTHDHGEH